MKSLLISPNYIRRHFENILKTKNALLDANFSCIIVISFHLINEKCQERIQARVTCENLLFLTRK